MTRYELWPRSDVAKSYLDLTVTIGWNSLGGTFFVIVADENSSLYDDGIIEWVGTNRQEIVDVDIALSYVDRWAIVPLILRDQLLEDQVLTESIAIKASYIREAGRER